MLQTVNLISLLMKIHKLTIEELNIPFKQTFSHAQGSRHTTSSVLIRAASDTGLASLGEGCPRSYVTGESIQSCLEFFYTIQQDIIDNIHDLNSLIHWHCKHANIIQKNPAAWCAIELALLDLLAQEQNISIEKLLNLPEISGTSFQYSAILGLNNIQTFEKQLTKYQKLGFADYKVKISGDISQDTQCLKLLTNIKVRLDANNAFTQIQDFIKYYGRLPLDIWAVEEPLQARDYTSLKELSQTINSKIILDESFTTHQDFDYIQDFASNVIINIRISKMGGILNALHIAQQCSEKKIPIIIGAQVGETSILTRAALTVAHNYRHILLAQEGAFGTYLLEHDITEPILHFGPKGLLQL